MKKLLLILILCSNICAAQDCDKYFKKNKESKSTVFDQSKTVTSKWWFFYEEGPRKISLSFTNMDSTNKVIIRQQTKKSINYKQNIVLGTEIQIAWIFDNDSSYIIKFTANEQPILETLEDYEISLNSVVITPELSNLLKDHKLKSIEIKNPFSGGLNTSKILIEDAVNADKIKEIYNCFLTLDFLRKSFIVLIFNYIRISDI